METEETESGTGAADVGVSSDKGSKSGVLGVGRGGSGSGVPAVEGGGSGPGVPGVSNGDGNDNVGGGSGSGVGHGGGGGGGDEVGPEAEDDELYLEVGPEGLFPAPLDENNKTETTAILAKFR